VSPGRGHVSPATALSLAPSRQLRPVLPAPSRPLGTSVAGDGAGV